MRHLSVLCTLMLFGCLPPDFREEELPPPPAAALALAAARDAGAELGSWPTTQWWHLFGDPQLNLLVEMALQQNPSLEATAESVVEALAAIGVTEAAAYPQVTAQPYGQLLQYAREGSFGAYIPPDAPVTFFINQVLFYTSWILDVWGQVSSGVEQGRRVVAQREAEHALQQLLISSQTTRAYFCWQAAQRRAELTEQRAGVSQAIAALHNDRVLHRLDSGRVAASAEAMQQNDGVLHTQARLVAEQMRHLLTELVATRDACLPPLQSQCLSVAITQRPLLPASLPLEIVGKRPDLVAARSRVEAAAQGVQVVRTAWYPNLDLMAGYFGFQAQNPARILNPGALDLGIGPALNLPWFDGGARYARFDAATSRYRAALAAYESSVLRATREVLDAVAAVRSTYERVAMAERSLASRQQEWQLARSAVESGVDSALSSYQMELQQIDAALQLNDAQEQLLLAVIALETSLGGGYAVDA